MTGSPSVKSVNFDQTGEKMIEFDLRVAPRTGIAKVKVVAVSGRNSSEYDLELDIRNANPPVTTFSGGTVENRQSFRNDLYTSRDAGE